MGKLPRPMIVDYCPHRPKSLILRKTGQVFFGTFAGSLTFAEHPRAFPGHFNEVAGEPFLYQKTEVLTQPCVEFAEKFGSTAHSPRLSFKPG